MGWRDLAFSGRYDIDRLDNRDEDFVRRFLGFGRLLGRYHRADVRGVERVPDGAALYVGNHNAGPMTPDTFIVGAALYQAHGMDALPYGLGHEWAIRIRGAHELFVPLGAVRASHDNAHRLFDAGKKVLVYPGGDLDSFRPVWRRHEVVFGGRKGYARLAIRAGVPIVPVVTCGAQTAWLVLSDGRWIARGLGLDTLLRVKAWPVTFTVPWGLVVGFPPPFIPFPTRILIELLDPIHFDRAGAEAADDDAYVAECAAHVESTMQRCLDRLKDERRALRRRAGR